MLVKVFGAARWDVSALRSRLGLVSSDLHRDFTDAPEMSAEDAVLCGFFSSQRLADHHEVTAQMRSQALQALAEIDALHLRFGSCASVGVLERYEETFRGPSLPAGDVASAEERRLLARDLADELGLPIGNAVDFWTEASLFSQAGLTALVYGPGDIAQAHTADEFVTLEQLQRYAESITRILGK